MADVRLGDRVRAEDGARVIEAYLSELAESLDVPPRTRRRILDEARDHLLEVADRGRELGLTDSEAERRAVEVFGAADVIARGFHEQLATAGAHRSSKLTGALLVGLLVVIGLAGQAGGWPSSGAYGSVAFMLGQVAVVAGALGVARSLRYRGAGPVPADRLVDIRRANGVALGCVGAVVATITVGVVTHARSLGDSGWTIALAVAVGGLASLGVASGFTLARSAAAARSLPAGPPREDAFDDLLALVPVPQVAGVLAGPVGWIRSRPWRFCALFAAACGLALAAGHGLTDGGLPALGDIWRALLGGLLLASIEGAAVVLAFACLGRYLGIRR
jgi:hypothetical protein